MNNSLVKLSDVSDLTVGYVGNMTKEYKKEGICFLRSLNIKPFSIDATDLLYISPEFNEQIKKSKLSEGDIVIVRTGTPGTCCVIPKEYNGCNCSDLVIIHPNKKLVDPYYLEAYINFMVQTQIDNQKVGAIQKHFNIGTAKNMLLFLPEINTQHEIASIVKALNEIINNNNKINIELESLAKTIYDYWFLQYDFPNDEGKPYRSSGGRMVWNEDLKREIPKNWKMGSFGDIIVENPKSTIQVNQITSAFTGFPFFTSGNSVLKSNKSIIDGRNCYLNTGGNADLKFYIGEASYSTDTWCITGYNNMTDFLYLTLSTIKKDFDVKFFQGTGLKHLQKPLLKKEKICIPPQSLIDEFNKHIQPMFNMISENIRENQELTSLRDWLLPLLINGQVGFHN